MYRVVIEHNSNKKISKHIDVVMKTEKLYELLGRYLLKYGPPTLIEETHGVSEYEYYRQEGKEFTSATISFAKIAEGKHERKHMSSPSNCGFRRTEPIVIIPPYVSTEPDDERLLVMVKEGVLETTPWHR